MAPINYKAQMMPVINDCMVINNMQRYQYVLNWLINYARLHTVAKQINSSDQTEARYKLRANECSGGDYFVWFSQVNDWEKKSLYMEQI